MSDEIKFRQYEKGDEKQINNLLQKVFHPWPHFDLSVNPQEHWKWKYLDNPLHLSAIAVAENDHIIIGCSHGFYLNVKVGNSILLAQQGVDLAVREDFRGRGIHDKLAVIKREIHEKNNVNLTYSLSGNPIVYKKDIKENRPQFPHQIQHMIKIYNIDKHFNSKYYDQKTIKKYGFRTIDILNKIGNVKPFTQRISKSDENFEISNIDKIDGKFDQFWEDIKDYYNYITVHDTKYINWRYCDVRSGNYIIKCAKIGQRIIGYMVVKINKNIEGYPEGYIVDLLTLPNRIDVAESLIIDAMKDFENKNINIIHALIFQKHPYKSLLSNKGFIKDEKKLHLFYRAKNMENELNDFVNSSVEKIHFMYGDLDWI